MVSVGSVQRASSQDVASVTETKPGAPDLAAGERLFRLKVVPLVKARRLVDVWTGIGKPEPAGVRGDDRVGASPGRPGELESWVLAAELSGDPPAPDGVSASRPGGAAYKSREHQRSSLDQLAMLNERHARLHPEHAALRGRMASCELAYRMQMAVPGIIDLEREPRHVLRAYGVDRKETAARSAASACWLGVWSNRGFGSCRSFPVGGTATTI